jgi:hypothetical protein
MSLQLVFFVLAQCISKADKDARARIFSADDGDSQLSINCGVNKSIIVSLRIKSPEAIKRKDLGPGMVVLFCDPTTQEAEAGESCQFKARLIYTETLSQNFF